MKFEKHIEIQPVNLNPVEILSSSTDLSKQAIKQAMQKGAVWLTRNKGTQRIRRAARVLHPGDSLHLYYDSEVLEQQVEPAILISDQKQYSIWNKPYGMLSQGSKWGDHCTINRWVEKHLQPERPAFIVHRLDRAATGLMIIAHQKKMASYFSDLFQNRKVEKHYQAIVHGQFTKYKRLDSLIDGKSAVSHIKPLDFDKGNNQSLVSVSIETGRKHQIRLHLSAAGFPIVGDRLYGREATSEINLCLSSTYLAFISPIDQRNEIYTLPEAYHLYFKSVQ